MSYAAPGKSPFPNKFLTKLCFSDTIAHAHIGGVVDSVYRGVSPYDPYFGVGGNSAAGFIQLANIYGKYRCFGSKISVTAQIVGTSGTITPTKLIVLPDLDSGPVTNSALALNLPQSKHRLFDAVTSNKAFINNFSSLRRMNAIRVADENMYTDTNGNQNPAFYWHIITANTSGVDSYTLQLTVSIIYYCEFSRPIDPAIFAVDPTVEAAADAAEAAVVDPNKVDNWGTLNLKDPFTAPEP